MMIVVACPNPDCVNFGVEFLWARSQQEADAAANGYTIGGWWCGGCSTDITSTARDVPDGYVPNQEASSGGQ